MCYDLPTPFLKIFLKATGLNPIQQRIKLGQKLYMFYRYRNRTITTSKGVVPSRTDSLVVYKQHVQESLPPRLAQALHRQYRFQQRLIQFNHTTATGTGSAMGIGSLLLLGAI